MPRQFLYDLDSIDLTQEQFGIDTIRELNPQRGHFEQLNAIVVASKEMGGLVARKDVRADEFWVPGHIPGRPLFPGVLMIEAAAQTAAFYTKKYVGWEGFIGFGGTGETKFRAEVNPGCTLYLLVKLTWARHRRIACDAQGVVNGNLVFETTIVGTQM